MKTKTKSELLAEIEELRARLEEAEGTRQVIRSAKVEAPVISKPPGDRIFSLEGEDHPYRIFVETMNEGALILADDGGIAYCNNRFAEIVKTSPEKLNRASIFDFIPPGRDLEFHALFQEGREKGSQFETYLCAQDGSLLPVFLSLTPLPGKGASTICAVVTDLTEQKRNEQIVAAERLSRLVLEQAGEAILVCDETGKIIRASLMAHWICAKNPLLQLFDTVIPLQLSSTPDQPTTAFSIFEALGGKVFSDKEVQFIRHEGTLFYLLLSTGLLLNEKDETLGCVVTLADITERKHSEEALRKSNEKFEILSETASKLLATDKPQQIVSELCQKMIRFLDCHAFFNYLVDEEKGRLHLNAYAGIPEETGKEIEWLDYGAAVCGCAARDASRIICENIPENPDPRTELVKSLGIKAYACHPFLCAGRVTGTLSFGTSSRTTFAEEELSLMKTVADQVAIAMERIRLIDALTKSRDELEIRVKQRTAELAKVNELLERVFSSIGILIAYMDTDFTFLRVNRAYAEANEREPEFYVGKNHFDLFPHEENEAIFKKVVETGEAYSVYAKPFQYAERPERGLTYWDWRLQPVKEPDGRIGGVVLSLMDVTERIRAEEEKKRSEKILEAFFTSTITPLVLLDRNFDFIRVNEAYAKVFRRDVSEFPGHNHFEFYPPEARAIFERVVETKTAYHAMASPLVFPDHPERGETHWNWILTPILDNKGRVEYLVFALEDVTQEMKIQEHLRQWQRMEALGTLAGGIAHDFNNILMPIAINTDLALLDIREGKSPSSHGLELVQEAAKRGQELVKQIITFSRQKEQLRRPEEIIPIIKEGLKFLRATIPKNIEMRERVDAPSALLLADAGQIHQVLINLCSNAAHAMRGKGGILEVSLSQVEVDADMTAQYMDLSVGPYIRLTVSDTGHGMDPEVKERAFDPFFTTKKPGEGTGMGLAVVHGIVKNHEGAIRIYSEVGKGTTVHVFLPRIQGEVEPKVVSSGPIPAGKERILLVDDEEIQVRSVQNMLERLGYRVIAKTDSRQALEVFRAQPDAFDLVITDQTMPHLLGQDLAREILSIRPDLPIILCTGFSELIHEEEAKAAGIRDFAMKPLTLRDMASRIRRALKE